ncbi:hypothetical protein ACFT5B_02970 [Luteimicrobium sp. NPDC057192]|uniref:hypothetical protein n=1 Tax=Luteimicrobium sp. NPDC057192 TaxID=3346042 RepID=UPI0036336BF5
MTPHDLDPGRVDLSARLRRLGATDDVADGPLAGVTALTERVRRRRRNRAFGSGAAVASVVAAALVLVPGSPASLLDRSTPQPAATTDVGIGGLCGLALTPEYSAVGSAPLGITVSGQRSTVTADETWSADITHGLLAGNDPSAFPETLTWDDTELALVATQGADAGHVVGIGSVPLQRGGSFDTSDGTAGTRAHNATKLVGCDGELLPAGQYRAIVVDMVDPARAAAKGLAGMKGVERTSAALPLTVRQPNSTPAGTTRPAWLDGTSLSCGMTDDELFRAMPDPVDFAVDMTAWSGSRPAADPAPQGLRLHDVGPDTAPLTVGKHPVLAWLDATTHKVVNFGADELATTRTLSVASGETLDYMTTGYDTTDYCAPSPDGTYSSRIPPGRYDVVVYTRVPEGTLDGSVAFLYRPGFSVRVRNDGTVTTHLGSEGDAAPAVALAKNGHQPTWLKGSGLTCGMIESSYDAQSWPGVPATFSTFFAPAQGRTGGELTATTAGGTVRLRLPQHVGVAWFSTTSDGQPYKLVSFGADPGTSRTTTVGKDGLRLYGSVDAPDSCAPDAHGRYTQRLPAGDYWLALYVPFASSGGHVVLTNSGEMGVTVDSDGRVTER